MMQVKFKNDSDSPRYGMMLSLTSCLELVSITHLSIHKAPSLFHALEPSLLQALQFFWMQYRYLPTRPSQPETFEALLHSLCLLYKVIPHACGVSHGYRKLRSLLISCKSQRTPFLMCSPAARSPLSLAGETHNAQGDSPQNGFSAQLCGRTCLILDSHK